MRGGKEAHRMTAEESDRVFVGGYLVKLITVISVREEHGAKGLSVSEL